MATHVIGFLLSIRFLKQFTALFSMHMCLMCQWAGLVLRYNHLEAHGHLGQEPGAGRQQKQPHKSPADLQHPFHCPQASLAAIGPTVVLRVPFFLLHSHRAANKSELHWAWAEFYFVWKPDPRKLFLFPLEVVLLWIWDNHGEWNSNNSLRSPCFHCPEMLWWLFECSSSIPVQTGLKSRGPLLMQTIKWVRN